jgi:hypothetical protein
MFMYSLLPWNGNKCYIISVCVCTLALDIWHAKWTCNIVIYKLSSSTNLFHILSLTAQFSEKFTEYKMCVLFSLQLLSETFPVIREFSYILLYMYVSLYYSCWILIKLEFSWEILKKYSNTKFHEIPSSESKLFHAMDSKTWYS